MFKTAIEGGKTRLAILTICAGVAFLASNDAMAKVLIERYDPVQVVFVRNLIALPIVAAVVLYMIGGAGFRTSSLHIHAMRGLLMLGGAYTFFKALETLALAEATALVFRPRFSSPPCPCRYWARLSAGGAGWRCWSGLSGC